MRTLDVPTAIRIIRSRADDPERQVHKNLTCHK